MAELEIEDIVGVYVEDGSNRKLLCMNCFKGDVREQERDDFLTREDLERAEGEKVYFCDECKKAI
jgi:hypothetical protein